LLERSGASGANDLLTLRAKLAAETYAHSGQISDLSAAITSHELFTIRPEGTSTPQRVYMKAQVATDHLSQSLADAIVTADKRRQVEFYTMVSKDPRFKSSAGYMFEKFFDMYLIGCLSPEEA